MMPKDLEDIDVVLLCGGLGTRLRPLISDRPKVLAKFGETTFLDILIHELVSQGFQNFILCVGYMKEQIKSHFAQGKEYTITFSEEESPLGTGGALRKAIPLVKSETFMVMNGDSICAINFEDFYLFHTEKKALLSMALVRTKSAEDFGSVTINESHEIISFKEKNRDSKDSLINAGMYLMQKEIVSYMPDKSQFSLETDFFPEIIQKKCIGYIIDSELIDIGTPERYQKAVDRIGGDI